MKRIVTEFESRWRRTTGEARSNHTNSTLGKKHLERRGKPLLRLAEGVLPDELLLGVFSAMVREVLPCFSCSQTPLMTVAYAAEVLLSPTISGTERLRPMLEQAILETTAFKDMVHFRRQGATAVVRVPSWARSRAHQIRNLQLHFQYELSTHPKGRGVYPSQLLQATRGMTSLAETFPNLHNLEIILDFELVLCGSRVLAILDGAARSGWQEMKSWREILLDLIAATKTNGPGKSKAITFRVTRLEGPSNVKETGQAKIDDRYAHDILEEATSDLKEEYF